MKARVPLMIQDPSLQRYALKRIIEYFDIDQEFLLDGPVTKQVAVLDFHQKTGVLLRGNSYLVPPPSQVLGHYEIANIKRYHSPDFIRVNVFATVLRTLALFEKENTMGRPLTWAFDGPQLLIVPRAGEWANAFYERASHSLQFFYFPSPVNPRRKIYTALSRDIISHETGHAIMDGIAPDLYNSLTPQALALHESIADLTALLMAFQSRNLRLAVLKKTRGSIKNSTAFSLIAEEFGAACDPERKRRSLRSLLNKKTLCPDAPAKDRVSSIEPHELSEVLSGALYSVLVKMHEKKKKELARSMNKTGYSVSGKALYLVSQRFKAMIFRALDYLPPGEISFADYCRALIASDFVSYPKDGLPRTWLKREFLRRCLIKNERSLSLKKNFDHPALKKINLDTLVESDWTAYEFTNRNRDLLRIPRKIPFLVRPRLKATKIYSMRGVKKPVQEFIFKVSWDHLESNPLSPRFPEKRRIVVGTTMIVDWETKKIRALLSSAPSDHPEERETQAEARNQMLLNLVQKGLLQSGPAAVDWQGKPTQSVLVADSTLGVMRVRGTARLLHIIGGYHG